MIANKYVIGEEIKRGSFGKILKGIYKLRQEQVAIKLEYGSMNTLKHEVKMMNYLFTNGVRKIPYIYWYGIHEEVPCLVLSYYECSLFEYVKIKTSISTTKMDILMIKAIEIIEHIHKFFVLHRDIKPHNFMVKDGDIYLIDFGLATFYIDETGKHYPDKISPTMIGTPIFASIHIHNGHTYSRRDDMISVGYMYLFMTYGNAYWFSVEYNTRNIPKESDINKLDISHPMNLSLKDNKQYEKLFCRTSEQYNAIQQYIKYVYSLEYAEIPKYEAVKHLFWQTS
jgi:serine/threonine protein kinase